MHEFVSDTAKFGDLTRGPRVIDERVKDNMRAVLKEVRDGTFAREWAAENKAGLGNYKQMLKDDVDHDLERVGAELRSSMSWLKPNMEKTT